MTRSPETFSEKYLSESSATAINDWLALSIGNSRLHWGWFSGQTLRQSWHTNHLDSAMWELSVAERLRSQIPDSLSCGTEIPLLLASVVPEQTAYWRDYSYLQKLTLGDIPLKNLYPSLGCDRALALYGAAEMMGYPCLLIDGGTALTFSAVNPSREFVGGAILPGIGLQAASLETGTAGLKTVDFLGKQPERWAQSTDSAIRSGILHSLSAGVDSFIAHWRAKYNNSAIVFTGGDGQLLWHLWQLESKIIDDSVITYRSDVILEAIGRFRNMEST